ncbi:MAG: DUF4175 family protein [Sphingomonadales bacterium]
MPESEEHTPGRLARILAVARWAAVGLLLAVVAVRYVMPHLIGPPEVVAIKPDDSAVVEDIRDKLVPPSQVFANPVARQLVEVGNGLVANPRERQDAVRQLFTLSENPDMLGDDYTTYLAVRSAYWQLRRDPQLRGSYETALMLWDAAERLESNSAIAAASREARNGIE